MANCAPTNFICTLIILASVLNIVIVLLLIGFNIKMHVTILMPIIEINRARQDCLNVHQDILPHFSDKVVLNYIIHCFNSCAFYYFMIISKYIHL